MRSLVCLLGAQNWRTYLSRGTSGSLPGSSSALYHIIPRVDLATIVQAAVLGANRLTWTGRLFTRALLKQSRLSKNTAAPTIQLLLCAISPRVRKYKSRWGKLLFNCQCKAEQVKSTHCCRLISTNSLTHLISFDKLPSAHQKLISRWILQIVQTYVLQGTLNKCHVECH